MRQTHTHGDTRGRAEAHTNNAYNFSETKILRSKTLRTFCPLGYTHHFNTESFKSIGQF